MANSEPGLFRIVGLPGDYIGAEVYAAAVRALDALTQDRDFRIELDEQLIGGAAVDATGEPLPAEQDELAAHGHAIESRIYAENPFNNFLPSTGRVGRFARVARLAGGVAGHHLQGVGALADHQGGRKLAALDVDPALV